MSGRLRPCTGCSHPTTSREGLCPSCKRKAAAGPLAKPCASKCGRSTRAKTGVCQECQRSLDPDMGGKATRCTECRIAPTTRDDGVCTGCSMAIADDEGPRGLGESNYDLDDLGHWAVDARGVWRFKEGPPAPKSYPQPPVDNSLSPRLSAQKDVAA